jgi:hypothetical protein
MPLVNFTNLDYDNIRESIKDYLRTNSNFTDYDYEGSNLSVIIDILAYNTYISSYNANMLSNEIFIDSATLRENIVSLAKNIGYVPRSRTASKAVINFSVNTERFPNPPVTLTLKKGVVCISSNQFNSRAYSFSIPEDITVNVVDNIAKFENIKIYEGILLSTNFTVNPFIDKNLQRYILDNVGIDTELIRVKVRDSATSSIVKVFKVSKNILNINSKSNIFFLQEIENERYELVFGDGVFGSSLTEGNVIEVDYLICNGEEANGISSFNFAGRLFDNNGNLATQDVSIIRVDSSSQGGKSIEDVNSIRNSSVKTYAAQNRAVTANDYEAIVRNLYPEIDSISVFGGETMTPPKYGRVFITIKPINGSFLSSTIKDNIKRDLRNYSVAGIVPEILDLKYLYIEYNSSVYYNKNLSTGPDLLRTKVFENISKYSKSSELNSYGSRFKYSKFLKIIDDSDISITSNITKMQMRRDLFVITNTFAEYEICFGNEFYPQKSSGYNIKSSAFRVSGVVGDVYITDIPDSNMETGKIILFRFSDSSGYEIVRNNIGTVDYIKGEINLYPINIVSTTIQKGSTPTIEISATPKSNDIIGLQDLYLQLDINSSILNMISDDISSGADISGVNYTVTSSYTNGDLIR